MGTILCPTRGGEASYANQDRAIALAKERGDGLLFLYVSNVEFLPKGSGVHLGNLEDDLDDMGDFLLTMAQERAEKRGLQAQKVVRRGAFQEALMEVIEQYQVTTVVLGSPGEEHRVTSEEYLTQLADNLIEGCDVEVMLTRSGKLIRHTSSQVQ
jgi:nucleotide-binding universal stress UspA family protein